MASAEQRVRDALREEGFSEQEIHLELTSSGNVGGFVISQRFTGMSQLDRQDWLWERLEQRLEAPFRQQIVSILTMTPDEVEDDVRVANG